MTEVSKQEKRQNPAERLLRERQSNREALVAMLYEYRMAGHEDASFGKKTLENFDLVSGAKDYALGHLPEIIDQLEDIDRCIEENLRGWSLHRLAKVDRAILEVAVYEMLFIPSIPHQVSINEALEIAKRFSNQESARFINGVLASVYRSLEGEKS